MFDKIHKLIVYLRRDINVEENFLTFDKLVKSNIDQILKEFDTRWLISICDTYADFGTKNESKNALQISILINCDRLCSTMLSVINDSEINSDKLSKIGDFRLHVPLWDGLTYYHLTEGDTIKNFINRMHNSIKDTPIIYSIFIEILNRINSEKGIKSNIKYMNDINVKNKFLR